MLVVRRGCTITGSVERYEATQERLLALTLGEIA